ncbi:unnamed protein product [Macrosiphum euphorbiae]|nr:unnamed protein product [Macrosiphum euphorbiae]
MSVDSEKLAAAVFLKEPIWNPRHAGHRSRTIIQQCWSDLSKEMIVDAETLKAKWKNMRDYYRAELKKHPSGKSGAGAEDVSNSTWPLFKCLSYLRNTMQTRTRSTNIISNFNLSEEADIESNSSHAYDVCQTQDNGNFTQDSSNIIDADLDNTDSDVSSPTGGLKKRNYDVPHRQTAVNNFRRELLNMEAKKLKLLENEEKEDEDLLFLKSLLPDLKKLSQTQKMRTKIKFQEILLQETLNLLQSTPTTNQTTVVSSFPYSAQWHINNEGTQTFETNFS